MKCPNCSKSHSVLNRTEKCFDGLLFHLELMKRSQAPKEVLQDAEKKVAKMKLLRKRLIDKVK